MRRTAFVLLLALSLACTGCGTGSGSTSTNTNGNTDGGSTPTGGGGGTGTGSGGSGGTGTGTGGSGGTGGGGSTTATDITVINHIIFTLQENRSFDHYFGRLAEYQRQKGMSSDVAELPLSVQLTDKSGNLISPFHLPTVCHDSLTPAWGASHVDYDDGKMDKFMHTANASTIDPDGTRVMGYYDWTDLPYYYEAATQFATSDQFFSPVLARTPANRMYMLGASSYGNINSGPIPATAPTIFDRLQDKGLSWKYYVMPNSEVRISHWNIAKTHPENIVPIDQYFTDLTNGTLPAVSFIDRSDGLDEHPTDNIQHGAFDMKQQIDAFMKSQYWKDSVFFLTYDEGGGLYDHVPSIKVPAPDDIPPTLLPTDKPGDFTLSGFRVPLIVFSPYVKPHYTSHVPREATAILKFIEVRFKLDPLTRRDAWNDDMQEMFDFTTPHLLTPPPMPEQPQNGKCNPALEVSPQHPVP
jgi:phospholipase C